MNKNKINYWLDFVLLILFLIVVITGFILKFAFVSGEPGNGRWITFLGFDKLQFISWHSMVAIVMSVLIIVHLVLHLKWIKNMSKKIFFRSKK